MFLHHHPTEWLRRQARLARATSLILPDNTAGSVLHSVTWAQGATKHVQLLVTSGVLMGYRAYHTHIYFNQKLFMNRSVGNLFCLEESPSAKELPATLGIPAILKDGSSSSATPTAKRWRSDAFGFHAISEGESGKMRSKTTIYRLLDPLVRFSGVRSKVTSFLAPLQEDHEISNGMEFFPILRLLFCKQ